MQVPRTRFARLLDAAFAHPRGLLGRLGGRIMGRATRTRSAWILELLPPQPDASILEVGGGPGALLHVLASHVVNRQILGIDAPVDGPGGNPTQSNGDHAGPHTCAARLSISFAADTESVDLVLSANSVPFWGDVSRPQAGRQDWTHPSTSLGQDRLGGPGA